MIDESTIKMAKEADLDGILDEFGWEKDRYNMIRCPHPDHEDNNPSCGYFAPRNIYKCFSCGRKFDAIDLYQCLAEKANGRRVPFYKAVQEVLLLDGMSGGISGTASSHGMPSQKSPARNSGGNRSPYDIVLGNSRPLTGYELNYLHGRGIMPYDSYVHGGKVYTVQGIENALREETDRREIQRLEDIRDNGTFHSGIAPILKANRIQIRHNYWQGVNSIIYNIDYDYYDDEDLQRHSIFLESTEQRHMAVQKTLDGRHEKKALGNSDFIWIAEGMGEYHTEEIYICEGIEDALSYTMNGKRAISLNSTENTKSLMRYLAEDYAPQPKEKFILSLDHDEGGRKAAWELQGFFEHYNQNLSTWHRYSYANCSYPQQFHDINDYWVSRVFS